MAGLSVGSYWGAGDINGIMITESAPTNLRLSILTLQPVIGMAIFALGMIADAADGKDLPVGEGPAGATVSVGDMFGTLLQNPQLLILFLAFTILYTAQFMYQANCTYYFIYIVGDFTKLTVATLISAIVGLVAAMIMPKVGAKMGKKNACVFGFCLFGIGLIAVSFLGEKSWIFYVVCMAVTAFGTYTYTPYAVIMFMDCGEYFLWKTGKDTRCGWSGFSAYENRYGAGRFHWLVPAEFYRIYCRFYAGCRMGRLIHARMFHGSWSCIYCCRRILTVIL